MSQKTPSKRYPGVYHYPVRGGIKWGCLVNVGYDWQTGKRIQKRKDGFATQEAARKWQIERKGKVQRGELTEPSLELFGAVCKRWLASQFGLRDKSLLTYQDRMKHVTARLGQIPISRITTAEIDNLYADLIDRGFAHSYIRDIHGTIRKVMRRSLQHNLIARDPSEFASPPASKQTESPCWTVDEMTRFLTATKDDPHWGLIWRVMAETWIRVGELIDLRWSAVDLALGQINITSTVTLDRNRKRISGIAKTDASRRTIPITAELVMRLRRHREHQEASELVFPAVRNGGWMEQPSVAYALKLACAKAKVPLLTPHGLRHSGGSVAFHRGVDIKTISERLGHTDVRFTMSRYIHSNEDQHRLASDKIGEILDGMQLFRNSFGLAAVESGVVTPDLE